MHKACFMLVNILTTARNKNGNNALDNQDNHT